MRIARALGATVVALTFAGILKAQPDSLPIIRRTEHGVVHILASDFRGMGIGLGYAQVEDYGDRVIVSLIRAKGAMGRTFGHDSIDGDFAAARDMARVRATFHTLDGPTRAVYDGFAEGVNLFIRDHPDRVAPWARPEFRAHDVAALDIQYPNVERIGQRLVRDLLADSLRAAGAPPGTIHAALSVLPPLATDLDAQPEDGSNAWALAPSRTTSGNAILLRNPHLNWDAGYWEAHVTIPGQLDFYGDFRIGSAFAVVGGFNRNLGWATTNNAPRNEVIYVLDADTTQADHYWFDGASVPLTREDYTVAYTSQTGTEAETRSTWLTNLGEVVHRTRTRIWVVRAGYDGEYRGGEQFLRMMRSSTFAEWKAAMAMQARATSNITYADRAGNIFNVWNATTPHMPAATAADTLPIPARTSDDVWNTIWPFSALPQTLNPPGGYVHNENSAPYYANLHAILDTANYPPNFERPSFSLRSQHAVSLIDNAKKLSLEDVIRLKHSDRMLLASRVKPDLLKAARGQTGARRDSLKAAVALLMKWDNRAAATSRGAVLFEAWWNRYVSDARAAGDSAFAEEWTPRYLTTTPRGLKRPDLAVNALTAAIAGVTQRYGAIDVPWGDVHRVRRGPVNVPVGGCAGALGCFRVLNFQEDPDGRLEANGGDGWVLAVEFRKSGPRAFSVLAYGQSPDSTSAYFSDQAAMFANGQLKPVRFTQADVVTHAVRTYTPGRP